MENLKLICFDWSGVISDDRIPVYEANMLVLQQYAKSIIPFEKWLEESPLNVYDFYADHGIQLSREEAYKAHKESLNNVKDIYQPTVYKNAVDILNYLQQKYQLAIISSHPLEHLFKEMQEYGIKQEIFTNIEANAISKAPAMINLLEKLHLANTEMIYIADTIHDIEAARKAGIKIISKSDGYHSKAKLLKYKPDLIIDEISELRNIL